MKIPKKLIDVALPLDAISEASVRERYINQGHPCTMHPYWARRPHAAARAVIFAQMVDDPSEYVGELLSDPVLKLGAENVLAKRLADNLSRHAVSSESNTTSEPNLESVIVEIERERLFKIIKNMVKWENTTNEKVLNKARAEIWKSWRRNCENNTEVLVSKEKLNKNILPAFHDPFAGGGTLPLEAQRLGIVAYASDLNPVAVMINKSMIEIPFRFNDNPPINPESLINKDLIGKSWTKGKGLAEDIQYYGKWVRSEAKKRIGALYPSIMVTKEFAAGRNKNFQKYINHDLTVIAWLWARTVKSPNPAFAEVDVPLTSSFLISQKKGKEAYVEPVFSENNYHFIVKDGLPEDIETVKAGTKLDKRANFYCLMSGTPIKPEYIKSEGRAGRMGARLIAIVAEGDHERVYLPPTTEHEEIVQSAKPNWRPETKIEPNALGIRTPPYGLTTFGDLFSDRQLLALNTFSDLINQVKSIVVKDAIKSGLPNDAVSYCDGGKGATAYGDAISVYMTLALDKCSGSWSTLCTWQSRGEIIAGTFSRAALPMNWDYAEGNPFSESSRNFASAIEYIVKVCNTLPANKAAFALQENAAAQNRSQGKIISTDPPYFDNVGYADLSDYFYIWMRKTLGSHFPDMFSTLVVPKEDELVAKPHVHGSKQDSEIFFLDGMAKAMQRVTEQKHPLFPVTIYYAFKQSETSSEKGKVSTGWEKFLDALIQAGFTIDGTWPIRTEMASRMRGLNSNALSTSIVLVCRKRDTQAASTTRREFISALQRELPTSLAHFQRGNIPPVDLAQVAIGPGMSIFTRYDKVLDAEGNPLTVNDALAQINKILDETLAEQEGDFDPESRWALAWFEQHGYNEAKFGEANLLAQAKNTGTNSLEQTGFIDSKKGKVRLLRPEELDVNWNPASESQRHTSWGVLHHLIRVLEAEGESSVAELVRKLGGRSEVARELCYRLYSICDTSKRANDALSYNGFVQSWPEILRLSREIKDTGVEQGSLKY